MSWVREEREWEVGDAFEIGGNGVGQKRWPERRRDRYREKGRRRCQLGFMLLKITWTCNWTIAEDSEMRRVQLGNILFASWERPENQVIPLTLLPNPFQLSGIFRRSRLKTGFNRSHRPGFRERERDGVVLGLLLPSPVVTCHISRFSGFNLF